MRQYHDALRTVLATGEPSTDRTGTGTIAAFGLQSRYAPVGWLPAGDNQEAAPAVNHP